MVDLASEQTVKGRLLKQGSAGTYFKALIHIAADVADGETVVIGSDTYEFDTDSSVGAGNIAVDVNGDVTPAAATDALIVEINTQDNIVRAIDLGANDVLLVGKASVDYALALSETMGGADNVIEAETFGGGEINLSKMITKSFNPTANEVVAGVVTVALTFTPIEVVVLVRDNSGDSKAWDGVATLDTAENLVKIDNSGAVDWVATDTVTLVMYG